MATSTSVGSEVHYPDSDGKPMAESPVHRDVMFDVIAGLQDWFVDQPMVYVSGNMFLYFVEGDAKRNVSPDVMVVRGIDKRVDRKSYKTWEEAGKAPDLVIEITSDSTRREDLRKKFMLYRDELIVPEYFLFDPLGDYLKPTLKGFRLDDEQYYPIEPIDGRLPSEVLGLHLEADGRELRLYDPATAQRLMTRLEMVQDQRKAIRQGEETIRQGDEAIRRLQEAQHQAAAENERLRQEIDALRSGQKKRE